MIPMVITREGNSSQAYALRSRLLKDRIIIVEGQIETNMAGIISDELLHLEAENPDEDITMYINSPGGEVYSGMAIVDTMNYIKPDVVTVVRGCAASMASIIAANGAKGKRFALPHSRIMIHQPSSGVRGMVSDIEIVCEESRKLKGETQELMAELTGQTTERIKADMDRDHWFNAAEALDYGIIDRIITRREEITEE